MHIRDYAEAYAENGWRVLPVHIARKSDGSKEPNFFRRSWKQASADPAVLAQWWNAPEEDGIAILCGPSNLVVIDLDGERGYDNFVALCGVHGIPQTLTCLTGGGGVHFYFQAPDNTHIQNSTGVLAEKVDVRGYGGCVFAPPTLHVSGTRYEWYDPAVPVALLPDWLLQRLTGSVESGVVIRAWKDRAEKELEKAVVKIRKAPEGTRRNTLNTHAYFLGQIAHLLGRDRIATALRDACTAAESVLPEAEIERTIDAGLTDGEARPRWLAAPWKKDLLFNTDGNAKVCEANVLTVLRNHPGMAGTLVYDERTALTVIDKPLPWDKHASTREWTEQESSKATEWMASLDPPVVTSTSQVSGLIDNISKACCVDTFREWLDDLQWDGVGRLNNVMAELCAARDPLDGLFFAKWLISAVARTYEPGSKVDTMFVFVGAQGLRKTSFFESLVPWPALFANHLARSNEKDSLLALRGPVIIEDGEMSMYGKREISSLKEFLTVCIDRYRAPYGRRSEDYPRRCVFCGSTNEDTFLRDVTGGRRFWPVKVYDHLDVSGLVKIREQLWAEARTRYEQGEPWWLERDTERAAENRQESCREEDAWEPLLEAKLRSVTKPLEGYGIGENQFYDIDNTVTDIAEGLRWITMSQALRMLGFSEQAGRKEQIRVSVALRAIGWLHRGRRRVGGARQSVWVPTKKYLTGE